MFAHSATPCSTTLCIKISHVQNKINAQIDSVKAEVESSGRLPDAKANELSRLFDEMEHLLSGKLECPKKGCSDKFRNMLPLRAHIEQENHRPEYGWRCDAPFALGLPGEICGWTMLGHNWKKAADHYKSEHGMEGKKLWEAQQDFVGGRPQFWCHFCGDFGPVGDAWLPHCALYHNGQLGQTKKEALYLSDFSPPDVSEGKAMEVDGS